MTYLHLKKKAIAKQNKLIFGNFYDLTINQNFGLAKHPNFGLGRAMYAANALSAV